MSILDALGVDSGQGRQTAGVAAGTVTNNRDPDGLGRVKLRFPWLSDNNETDWVRIATLTAGSQRGSFFLPEVGDEALVAFEHGDLNHPYVIGFLWNGNDTPPETNSDGKNNIRKITSRSGHEIILDDTDSGEKVEIHTKAGHKIVLDDGGKKIEITDSAGSNKVTVDAQQNEVSIESGTKLKLKSSQIDIEADGMMTIKASGTLTLQGSVVKIN